MIKRTIQLKAAAFTFWVVRTEEKCNSGMYLIYLYNACTPLRSDEKIIAKENTNKSILPAECNQAMYSNSKSLHGLPQRLLETVYIEQLKSTAQGKKICKLVYEYMTIIMKNYVEEFGK